MTREQLQDLKLEALRTLAAEHHIDGARSLSKAELIDRLAPPVEKTAEPEASAPAASVAAAPPPRAEGNAPVAAEPAREATEPAAAAKRGKRGTPTRAGFDIPSSTVHPHADELETLTMARLYAAEGQLDRALEIYQKLAALDPDDEEARAGVAALLEKRGPRPPAPEPKPHAPSGEPIGMLDLEELPETYGVDECEVIDKDPSWVFAYWEVTDAGLAAARAQLGPSAGSARLVLRLFTTLTGPSGVEREIHDVDLQWNHGRRYLQSPHPGAHLRVAVGLLSIEGYFAPIAHSSLVRIPPREPAPEGPVEWMEVVPARTRGREREPLVIVRRGQDHAERGLGHGGLGGGAPGSGPTSSTTPPPSIGWSPGSGSGSGSPTGGR